MVSGRTKTGAGGAGRGGGAQVGRPPAQLTRQLVNGGRQKEDLAYIAGRTRGKLCVSGGLGGFIVEEIIEVN